MVCLKLHMYLCLLAFFILSGNPHPAHSSTLGPQVLSPQPTCPPHNSPPSAVLLPPFPRKTPWPMGWWNKLRGALSLSPHPPGLLCSVLVLFLVWP